MDRRRNTMNRTLSAAVAATFAAASFSVLAGSALLSPAAAQEPREGERADQQEPRQQESQVARAGDEAAQGFGIPAESIDIERSGEYGQYLVDGRGEPLYVLESESSGESNCYDACALAWPPVLALQGQEVDAEHRAIDENLLGTTQRRDGQMQLTYNDYPLYYYARDPGDGEVTGHDGTDEWGEWYLVTPEGEPLHEDERERG
jgi:predicted lipoprotein with Yx(FWY)xxD motif